MIHPLHNPMPAVSMDLKAARAELLSAPVVVIDTETTGIEFHDTTAPMRIVGFVAYAPGSPRAFYLPTYSWVSPDVLPLAGVVDLAKGTPV